MGHIVENLSRRMRAFALLGMALSVGVSAEPTTNGISESGLAQIATIMAEKANRTPTENKLDSNLLHGMRAVAARRAGRASAAAPYVSAFVAGNVAADDTVEATIRATVSDELLSALKATGAQDVASFPQFDTITARMPIAELLALAARADVRFIGLTEKPVTNRYVPTPEEIKARLARYPHLRLKSGSVDSEGVLAHKAKVAFDTGINGAGVFVCAMSNGIDSLSARQASGDLPPVVYELSGQAGSGDEGTAMLEIIHDMAPYATLGFATAGIGIPNAPNAAVMSNNIDSLRLNGCKIIVDDATLPDEGAFQDGIVAQAISRFTAAGGLYFSSSANSGNLTHLNSGTWEGDFADSGISFVPDGAASRIHAFGSFVSNPLQNNLAGGISLKWSDPLGAATNDYDLFLLDSTGATILQSSSNSQAVTQQPYEAFTCSTPTSCPAGAQVVIVKYSGVQRALRLDARRGKLGYATSGSTYGHSAAATAITVAAVDVATAGGGAFVGGAANPVEAFSSDGPRKMFYNPDGTAITPGNVLFGTGGGTTLQKVDLAAADNVRTSTPGYNPFPGTSAAAPHAAAIAALAWSAKPTATAAVVKAALFASAVDIEAPGADRDSGVGIVMADASVRAMLNPISITKSFSPPRIAPGGTSTLTIALTNSNAVALQNVAFTDSYPPQIANTVSPNVTGSGIGCAGLLTGAGGGGSVSMTAGAVAAGGTCTITVQVTASTVGAFADNSDAVTTPIALNSPGASATLTVVAINVAPASLPGGTVGTGYNQSVTSGGGVAPYGYAITAGAQPNGLSLPSGGTLTGTPTLAGNFTFTVTATDSTSAALGGPFTGTHAYIVSVVNPPANVVVGANFNPSAVAQTVVFTATLSGGVTPTGTVNFFDGATGLCANVPVNSGQAICAIDTLPVGTRSITAAYSGDVNYSGATSAIYSQIVNASTSRILTVSKGGTGSGTVTSAPTGINCGVDCSEPYVSTTSVTLTATALAGSTFVGWLGACVGNASCAVTVSAAINVSATFAPAGVNARLDIDNSSSYSATTDGLLALRYMLGLTGTPLTQNAIGANSLRFTPSDIADFAHNIRPWLDVDRNGKVDAVTDGVLVIRYLFGLRGDALVAGAISVDATRTASEIEAHLQTLTTP